MPLTYLLRFGDTCLAVIKTAFMSVLTCIGSDSQGKDWVS